MNKEKNVKRNMKQWAADLIAAPVKKPLPLLSFPCVQLMDVTVEQLIKDSALQANGMKLVADRVPSAASVSLMDLSVEAEAFGSRIRVSADEVPTVVGAIVSEEEDADSAGFAKGVLVSFGKIFSEEHSEKAAGNYCRNVDDCSCSGHF